MADALQLDPSLIPMLARGVALPQIADPLELAAKGATLRDLMAGAGLKEQQYQTAAQQAKLWADPDVMQYFSQMLGGGQGGPGGAQLPAAAFAANPLGAASIVGSATSLAEKTAQMKKDQADAAEKLQQVRASRLNEIGNTVDGIFKNGFTVPQLQMVHRMVSDLPSVGVDPNAAFGPPPDPSTDPKGYVQWLTGVGDRTITPEQRASTTKTYGMLPLEQEASAAGTAKTRTETAQAPSKLQLDQQKALTERTTALLSNMTVDQTGHLVPKVQGMPGTGDITGIQVPGATPETPQQPPPGAGGATPPPSGLVQQTTSDGIPVMGAPGQYGGNMPARGTVPAAEINYTPAAGPAPPPPAPTGQLTPNPAQIEQSAVQKASLAANAEAKKAAFDQSSAAQEMRQLLLDMHQRAAAGMLQGGVLGTDEGKRWANVLAGLGYLSPEQNAKLQNAQVFDAASNTLIAEAVRQFAGAKVAAREIPFFATTKPATIQTYGAMEDIMQQMWDRTSRYIQRAQGMNAYEQQPGFTDFSGYNPPTTNEPMPPPKLDKAPDANWAASIGKKIVDANGVTHRPVQFRGGFKWVPPLPAE